MLLLFLLFLRNHHTHFHRNCTKLHSHQKYANVLFSPHPFQNLFVNSLMFAIPTSVSWYLMALICISLIISVRWRLWFFQWSCMDVRVGLWRKLRAEKLMLLNCWKRLLRVPWTARRSNQSILKEISPGCSLEEGLMLKLQYFGNLTWRVDSLEKTLMLGGIGGKEEKGMTEDEMVGWHHWLDELKFE